MREKALGRLVELGFPGGGVQRLVLELYGDFREAFDRLHGETVDLEIKKHRKGRSLDANAYFWVLLDRLAEATCQPKTELYKAAVREMGGNSDTVAMTEEAAKKFCGIWESRGLGWITETFPSQWEGYVNVSFYYGSSAYDTAQMSRLIDLVIQDCKAVGVETMTPMELARLAEDGRKE